MDTLINTLPALGGGIMLGLAAAMLMLFNGKIFGVSGILSGTLHGPSAGEGLWKYFAAAGIVLGGVVVVFTMPEAFEPKLHRSMLAMGVAGLLVGFGARFGNGCTSGHGICGMGRLSKRSIIATTVFTVAGIVAVLMVNRLFGGVI